VENHIFKLYPTMIKKMFCTLSIVFFANYLTAQVSDKEAIKAVINQLFEGMNKCDSSLVKQVMHPNVALNSIGFSEKNKQNYFVFENRISPFLQTIAKPKTELWNEKATSFEIKIDGSMAEAWVPYTFHLGDKFSHCGVDNFILFKEDLSAENKINQWKIIYLVDTMRKDNCVK
jgi:hypothetical protein